MVTLLKPYSPPFVTEANEPPPWTDCTWASGLMAANKASGGKYPSTRAEREALRDASGDHIGGSNLGNLAAGIHARYGWTLTLDRPAWHTLLLRLARGDGAVVQGDYAKLPKHFQRWDTRFAAKPNAFHAAYAQGHDRGGNFHLGPDGLPTEVFWCDPLGRSDVGTPAGDRYRGEWMPIAALHAFLNGLAPDSGLLVATVKQRSVR